MRARELATTIAVSALALTGCSGSGEDEGSDTSSTSRPDTSSSSSSTSGGGSPTSGRQSTTSSSPATEEGPPPEAQANTKEGAEAFAKWYLVESGDSLTDGDVSAIRSASADGCKVCKKAYQATVKDAQALGVVAQNPYSVSVLGSEKDEQGVWRVKLRVSFDDYEYVKNGKTTTTVRKSSFEVNPQLGRVEDQWVVQDWLVVL